MEKFGPRDVRWEIFSWRPYTPTVLEMWLFQKGPARAPLCRGTNTTGRQEHFLVGEAKTSAVT